MGADLSVETVGSLNGLRRLEPEWTALWKRAPSPRVTLAHWWVLAFWTHMASACPLRVVVVRDHGRPVLIAPLMAVETVRGPVRERWLQTIGSYRSGPTDILCPEPEPHVLDAMWRYLEHDRRWDCVALWQVPSGSPTLPSLLRLADARGMSFRLLRDDPGYVVPSASGWPAFEASLDRKLRENVRRRRRKLEAAHGPLEFRRVSTLGRPGRGASGPCRPCDPHVGPPERRRALLLPARVDGGGGAPRRTGARAAPGRGRADRLRGQLRLVRARPVARHRLRRTLRDVRPRARPPVGRAAPVLRGGQALDVRLHGRRERAQARTGRRPPRTT